MVYEKNLYIKDILKIEKNIIYSDIYLEYVKDIILIENKFITSYNNNLLNKVIQNEYKNLLYRKIDYKNKNKKKKKKKKKANIIISDKDYYGIDDYLTIYENKNNIDFNIIKKNILYNRNKTYIESSYKKPNDIDTYINDFGRKPDNICIYCYNYRDIIYKYVCKDCYFEYKNKIIIFSYYMKNKYKININDIKDNNKLLLLFKSFLNLIKVDYKPYIPISNKDIYLNKYINKYNSYESYIDNSIIE